jgi:hypothetical protein
MSEVLMDAGFSGVRPTPRQAVDAFLESCYPGSRRTGEPEDKPESGFAMRACFKTASGVEMVAYLNPAPHGGWKIAKKGRVAQSDTLAPTA